MMHVCDVGAQPPSRDSDEAGVSVCFPTRLSDYGVPLNKGRTTDVVDIP
jgi:hypothetical protein